MVIGSFRVGQRLALNGQPHRVFRDLGSGVVAIEELTTGRITERRIADLLDSWRVGDLTMGDRSPSTDESTLLNAIDRAHGDAFLQSYTDDQQHRARAKLAFVERLERLPRTGTVMTPIIEDIWSDQRLWNGSCPFENAPHFTTVARWIQMYIEANRDIRVLVDRHHDKGNASERVDSTIRTIVDDLIQTRYLTEERPTIKTLRKEIKGMVALRNATRLPAERLQTPSYSYLKNRIQDIAPYDVCRARYGARIADLKFRVAGRGATAVHPLARACMDHCRMDAFVVDERTRLPLGRPWLTIVIDEHSRYVLGYYISFEEPSSVSMTRALRHALSPKVQTSDVKSEWDAWGVMETLVVDNGMEFHSRALEAGAGRFGIIIQFCPRRKPWFKGKVERFFGTMGAGLLGDLKGKTFSSHVLRGDYDPSKHAVMTLATLRRIVHMWIVDIYHHEVHSGLGMTPADAWRNGVDLIDRYLPPSSIAVESAFSSSSFRRLTHKGIEFDLLLYNSRELGALRELYGSEIEVEVRTHDDDLGSIVVVAPDGKTLVKVPALHGDYANGLTRWQHQVCKRFQRRIMEDDAREISLLEARNRIRALIEQDMHLTSRKTRNKQQRFVQQDFASSDSVVDQSRVEPVVTTSMPVPIHEPIFASPVAAIGTEDADEVPDFSSRMRRQVENQHEC